MILCLGAHPDDIELGAGGTIALGEKEVVGITFTCQSAFKHLLPEMLNSWKILGIKYVPEFDQNHKHRDLDRQAILDTMIRIREHFKPEVVLTHSSFDTHQDHKVIHEETARAFKHSTILGYCLPWNDINGSSYRHFEKLPAEVVKRKFAALCEYKSQSERTYFNLEYQKALLLVNGQQCGSRFAEKFEVIRQIC
jgi:LmbE family N-acetylglucosaminyl deacetylase